jgi:hypothetical protein
MKRVTLAVILALAAVGSLAFAVLADAILSATDSVNVDLPAGEYRETPAGSYSYGGRGAKFYTSESATDGAYVLLEGDLQWKPGYGGNARLTLQGQTDGVYSDFAWVTWDCDVTTTGGSLGGSLTGEKTTFASGEGFSTILVTLPDGDTYYDVTYSCDVEFEGQMTADRELHIHVAHNGQFSSDLQGTQAVMWTEEPPVSYCPDGTEALSGTVDIPLGSSWALTTTTALDAVQVRYLITRTDNIIPSYVHGTVAVNGAEATFNQYPVPVTVTAPLGDFGVSGPDVLLSVENTGGTPDDDFTLLSACIIPATVSPYCPSGMEVLPAPVVLDGWDLWEENNIETGWDEVAVTYWLDDVRFPSAYGIANEDNWLFDSDISGGATVSFTIPPDPAATGGIEGPTVDLGLRNAGVTTFTLTSVCVSETHRIEAPTDCNLTNHDFITSTNGWEAGFASLTWTGAETDSGAASLEPTGSFGLIYQGLTTRLYGAYEVTARLRSSSTTTNTVTLYAQNTLVQNGYWEAYTTTVGTDWTVISADFYMLTPSQFAAQSDDDEIIIDWFCITDASPAEGWRPTIPVCTFPSFDDHPEFSVVDLLMADPGSNWFWWLATKIGDLAEWLVCRFERQMMILTSMIMDALDEMGIPEIPDEVTLESFIFWLKESFRAFSVWLRSALGNLIFSGRSFGEWLRDQLIELAGWLWEDIILEVIEWAIQQAEAAGLIGEDAVTRLLWMFRNADIWLDAAMDEAAYELDSALLLLEEMAAVFGVLIEGMRAGLTGDTELDMGESLGGFAAYLWRGVEFINTVVADTPLAGLNVVALGIIAWGLAAWSVKRFTKILGYLV